ncbi:MAG TPA: hypothetical protein V6C78_25235 [Crinalium sp.]
MGTEIRLQSLDHPAIAPESTRTVYRRHSNPIHLPQPYSINAAHMNGLTQFNEIWDAGITPLVSTGSLGALSLQSAEEKRHKRL